MSAFPVAEEAGSAPYRRQHREGRGCVSGIVKPIAEVVGVCAWPVTPACAMPLVAR